MADDDIVDDARRAILSALQKRKRPAFLNKRDIYGRTLAGGEAAFHALTLISQMEVDERAALDDTVPVPKWVFDDLVFFWKVFLLTGSSKTAKKTLGQVFGCEAMTAGGREGAKLSRDTWNELRIFGVAISIEKECERNGIQISKEELAGVMADQLAVHDGDLKEVSQETVARYLKKYRRKAKKVTTS